MTKNNPKPISARVPHKKSKGSLKRDRIFDEKHQSHMAMRSRRRSNTRKSLLFDGSCPLVCCTDLFTRMALNQ